MLFQVCISCSRCSLVDTFGFHRLICSSRFSFGERTLQAGNIRRGFLRHRFYFRFPSLFCASHFLSGGLPYLPYHFLLGASGFCCFRLDSLSLSGGFQYSLSSCLGGFSFSFHLFLHLAHHPFFQLCFFSKAF